MLLDEVFLGGSDEPAAWELYHENSKTSRFDDPPANEAVRAQMTELLQSLDYSARPEVELPGSMDLPTPLSAALHDRITARDIQGGPLTLNQLATLMQYAYGLSRDNAQSGFPRPFRVVPSGGALYPLEIYVHTTRTEGLAPGIHHFNPTSNKVQLIVAGDCSRRLAEALVQPELALSSSVIIAITAVFERSVFKYGERGYRFALLEAGHVAQNINLVAAALGLGCVNIGGFFDRLVDDLLELDGVRHSSVYLLSVGHSGSRPSDSSSLPPVAG